MSDQFYTRALAAGCVDPSSIFDDFDDNDVSLVAQLMEVDDRHQRALAKIAASKAGRPTDRRHLFRCREVEKEITAAAKQRKRDLLLLWLPSFGSGALNH